MKDARESHGSAGLHSIIALLLAMEAAGFVVTTNSNWSRLIDEPRQTRAPHAIFTDLSNPHGDGYTNW